MKDIFCIDCRYDHEFNDACTNPKGLYEVKTPWRLERKRIRQTTQNANNDCPWFEDKKMYKPRGFFATILWKVYRFLEAAR